ncbi:MAG: hypothetical protein MI924_06725, partial [Chloroflexales bacterium]|nr:hypothetical protein [Chloroflexales bacterium]
GAISRHTYAQLFYHSVLPHEYLLPNPLHLIWGDWASQFLRPEVGEHWASLGYTAAALALAGAILGWRQRIVQALVIIALINVVMTLGPEWELPDGRTIPLPAGFVYAHVPILDNIRAWSRMTFYVSLCVALLASLALTKLPRRWYSAGWIVAAGLVVLESIANFPIFAPHPRPVDLWLRQQAGPATVIDMPDFFNGSALYYTLFSEKANNGGYGTFAPRSLQEDWGLLQLFPYEPALRLMQRWQTDYIIVDTRKLGQRVADWEEQLATQLLVRQVYQDAEYRVYRLQR